MNVCITLQLKPFVIMDSILYIALFVFQLYAVALRLLRHPNNKHHIRFVHNTAVQCCILKSTSLCIHLKLILGDFQIKKRKTKRPKKRRNLIQLWKIECKTFITNRAFLFTTYEIYLQNCLKLIYSLSFISSRSNLFFL